MIVSWTGHRPEKLGGHEAAVRAAIDAFLDEVKPELCIVGMARGVDMIAARACYDKGIPYQAFIPFPEQAAKYPDAEKKEYLFLLEHADAIECICPEYKPWAFQDRNEAMADCGDIVAAVWDGSGGGTGNMIKYCRSKQGSKEVRYLQWPNAK